MGLFDRFLPKDDGNNVRPVNSTSEFSNDEKNLAAYVKRKVEESRMLGSRITYEGIWMTNIAYLMGFDGVYYDTSLRQFKNISKGSRNIRRSRIRANKILPSVQNRLARLCKNPPRYDVRPNSNDQDDKEASRLGVQVLDMVWDSQAINKKRIDLLMWVQECGHGYLKVSYDDQLGKCIVDPVTNEMIYEGDIRVDVCSPLEIFPDPLAKSIDDATWMCQAKVRRLDYFKTHYPENGNLVKEEDAWLLSAQYEMRINSLNNRGQGQTGPQQAMKDAAIEIIYYEKRSKKHPNGRMIVAANGVLLADKELPVGEIPLVKFDDVVIGGKFYPESVITHARPLQDQYNKLLTQRANWTNKLLHGKYLAAKGHGLIQEAINDQIEVIEHDPVPNAPAPAPIPVPVIPEYAYKEEESLVNNIYDIFGINEVSRGQLPAAGIPAVGMQFLMEQDDTRIGVVTEQHEHAYARLGQLILMYAQECFKTPRMLKVAGDDLEYTIKPFMGADLRDNHDVIVMRGSTLPGSKVLRRQEIINAYQQGFLGDPADPKVREKVLGLLEYGDVGEMWEEYGLDMAQIKQQIEEIEQGIAPDANELDNHELHIMEKNKFRKTEKYKRLDPISQQLLINDIEKHITFLMDRINPGMSTNLQSLNNDMQNYNQMATGQAPIPTPPPVEPPPEGP